MAEVDGDFLAIVHREIRFPILVEIRHRKIAAKTQDLPRRRSECRCTCREGATAIVQQHHTVRADDVVAAIVTDVGRDDIFEVELPHGAGRGHRHGLGGIQGAVAPSRQDRNHFVIG